MANEKCHTLKAFDEDLSEIRTAACQMGGLAEMAIHDAVCALVDHDLSAAARVIGADARVDLLSIEIERRCICLIALRAPMADDLRAVLASFQIASLIERIGDGARAIAEQVPHVPRHKFRGALPLLRSTAAEVRDLVRAALDSFAFEDSLKAKLVCKGSDRVESLTEQLFRDLLDAITDDSENDRGSCAVLMISQNLQRIGEDAANIGRVVYFLCTGKRYSPRSAPLLPAEERVL